MLDHLYYDYPNATAFWVILVILWIAKPRWWGMLSDG